MRVERQELALMAEVMPIFCKNRENNAKRATSRLQIISALKLFNIYHLAFVAKFGIREDAASFVQDSALVVIPGTEMA